jgi:hypothetical protein
MDRAEKPRCGNFGHWLRWEIRFAAGDTMHWRRPKTLLGPLFGMLLLVGGLDGHAAQAADWRYCLALAPRQHTVYMSAPFSDDESMETTEAAFGRALDRALVQHDSAQCPLGGNAQSIAAMKQQAIQYNRASGNKVVQLNWQP